MNNCTNCRYANKSANVAGYNVCMNWDSVHFALKVTEKIICSLFQEIERPVNDLTYGLDCRGDYALFVDIKHINGWTIDAKVKRATKGRTVFFRVIEDGEQKHSHGWIEKDKIIQWG